MTLVTWNDSYKTGIESIDFEHEKLINEINAVCERISEGCSDDKTYTFLAEIHAMIEAHFALEEKIMRDYGYAEYPRHKRDHDQLLEDIRDIMDSVGHRHDADYEHLLAERVGDWFGQHFGTLDRDFHSLKK